MDSLQLRESRRRNGELEGEITRLLGEHTILLGDKTRLQGEATKLQQENTRLQDEVKELDKVEKERERHKAEVCDMKLFLKRGPYSDIETGLYTDFKVKCGEKIYYLHRSIIFPQCKFFAAALRPGGFEESTTGLISLPEDDPRIFKMLVQLIYLQGIDCDPEMSVLDYVKLYVMADKYEAKEAAAIACKLASPVLTWVLAKACKYWGEGVPPNKMAENWSLYTEAVEYLYSNVPATKDPLKQQTMCGAGFWWRNLAIDEDEVHLFLEQVPEFACALLASCAKLFTQKERDADMIKASLLPEDDRTKFLWKQS